jgi:hypothetical protein
MSTPTPPLAAADDVKRADDAVVTQPPPAAKQAVMKLMKSLLREYSVSSIFTRTAGGTYVVSIVKAFALAKQLNFQLVYMMPVVGVASCELSADFFAGDELSDRAQLAIYKCVSECNEDFARNHELCSKELGW